ncbi:unnamed protein product [Amaranthus hypochondriacus]
MTTARRKGIVIDSFVSQGGSNSLSEGNRVVTDVDVDLNEENEYVPMVEEDLDVDVDLNKDDDDDEGDEAIAIHDNLDPFSSELLDDEIGDDDNYFNRLYRNGAIYKNEFGAIVLKPWQLFIDKQHLRDVVRDYCIQCGFSVVVVRAKNHRYTVRYAK